MLKPVCCWVRGRAGEQQVDIQRFTWSETWYDDEYNDMMNTNISRSRYRYRSLDTCSHHCVFPGPVLGKTSGGYCLTNTCRPSYKMVHSKWTPFIVFSNTYQPSALHDEGRYSLSLSLSLFWSFCFVITPSLSEPTFCLWFLGAVWWLCGWRLTCAKPRSSSTWRLLWRRRWKEGTLHRGKCFQVWSHQGPLYPSHPFSPLTL